MRTEDHNLACAVIQALVDDWMLVEDLDSDTLFLVNESRAEMEGLKPSRDFVATLEREGYIKNFGVPLTAEPIFGEQTLSYPDGRIEVHQSREPHVFDFRPTPEGLTFLLAERGV